MNDLIQKNYDVIIVGGGLSGLCAAIASARGGASTALIHNRPVLGGNASSEIRMHICGADNHGHRTNARETGILEEILLENRKKNPQSSYSVFDTILWEKAHFQDHLDLFLNTHMTDLIKSNGLVKAIIAEQLTTEKKFQMNGRIFVDATGDGTLALLSGASYMEGRESKNTFNESHAPETKDSITMGNTLLFKTIDMGMPMPFEKPAWANTYTEADLNGREHGSSGVNYWWIELGGDDLDVIADGELLRDELLKAVYGVWEHIKNASDHGADHYALDWIGFLPGKRESRRIVGDYILKETDLSETKQFEDAVAYGGWPMDIHVVGGLRTKLEPTEFIHVPDVYTIPYQCLYSKDVNNLMLAGRAVSVSHMAFGSTRVMGTCAVVGQAVGTAAAIAIQKNCLPHELLTDMKELQLQLLRDDAYIPGVLNHNPSDQAKKAHITASSNKVDFECSNLINGVNRTVHEQNNCWVSGSLIENEQWVDFSFDTPKSITYFEIKFDSNLSKQLMISMFKNGIDGQEVGIPKELVRNYSILFYLDDICVHQQHVKDNYLRYRKHIIEPTIAFDRIRLEIHSSHGEEYVKIFEVSMY